MNPDWLKQRSRGVHLTIRDIDCRDFDVEQLAQDLTDMGVNILSFFCAGYVTTHQTDLSIRRSPYLGDRDLTGDIVAALKKRNIRAVPAMDLSLIPGNAAQEHPDWCSLDREGNPYRANKDLGDFYIACPLSGYQNEYLSLILKEIVTRYDIDGIKFGGGSYGFTSYGNGICYCERCKAAYHEHSGADIPLEENWEDPNWGEFQRWRQQRVVDRSKFLYDLVKSLHPELPVMCNSVAFGDPGWTIKGSLDIERMAKYIDAVQVEAQTRVRVEEDRYHWDYLYMPAEEANYLNTVSDHQPWVLASYFQAWPWRRNAVPPAEQKVYMAQVFANGGNAILNLSGGPPKGHEDKRGFPAVASLYKFVAENQNYFTQEVHGSQVALLYSQTTMFYYGQNEAKQKYVEAIRGFEQALIEAHIPFQIISDSMLTLQQLQAFKVLVLPTAACMSEEAAKVIEQYVAQGGSVVATFESSLFDLDGKKRSNFLLSELLGVTYMETASVMGSADGVFKQAYMNIQDKQNPLLKHIGETEVIPAAYQHCKITAEADVEAPLTLSAAFRVFPEGMSYTVEPDTGYPMAVTKEHASGGRTVYFAGQPDISFFRAGYPDWATLMVNAIKWGLQEQLTFETNAPSTMLITLRLQESRKLFHFVNMNGGRRMFQHILPARDVELSIPVTDQFRPVKAYMLSNQEQLALTYKEDMCTVTIPIIDDYDVLVFEG
ncbi:alpha-amylase family protein [Paenibacillus camelliae]|uniref:alpha-amylase family protein n=1 Tax=Paenibacillus camelliae TaxID=512410 RepID=UPI00203A5E83|nr:beta-galactosidase trimerization domain-containing protein [Paenibacillus camelliae]MCM3632667.1 beta-galactosidase trimerization domain-containing protein [Paenibacillus camelliae]